MEAMATVREQERVNLSILDRPTPGRLFAPQTRSLALAGGLLGLLCGLMLVLVLDYADETFRGAGDVERSLGLHVVGVVPPEDRISPWNRPERTTDGTRSRPDRPVALRGDGAIKGVIEQEQEKGPA